MAAFGLLNPMIAGGAMAFSSVSVVSNSLLLKRYNPRSRGGIRGDALVKAAAAGVMAFAIWLAFFYTQPFNTVRYDLTIREMELPVELTVKAGQQVRVSLTNEHPDVIHNFTIQEVPHRFLKMVRFDPELHMHGAGADVAIYVSPGRTAIVEFTPTVPGRYAIGDPGQVRGEGLARGGGVMRCHFTTEPPVRARQGAASWAAPCLSTPHQTGRPAPATPPAIRRARGTPGQRRRSPGSAAARCGSRPPCS